jgi:hypothetical protein
MQSGTSRPSKIYDGRRDGAVVVGTDPATEPARVATLELLAKELF